MAKETVNILKDKIDIVELLAQLNAALSEEWLAFYQYWVGSFVVEGAMRGDVQREFQEHAAEEYNHAKLLADRIIELEAAAFGSLYDFSLRYCEEHGSGA